MRLIVVCSIMLVATVSLLACDRDPIACTAQAVPAIGVSVQDSASGAPAGRGAEDVRRSRSGLALGVGVRLHHHHHPRPHS